MNFIDLSKMTLEQALVERNSRLKVTEVVAGQEDPQASKDDMELASHIAELKYPNKL